MGSLYLWGHSIQEMGSDVVIGRSIYGVVVIDRSFYCCNTVYRIVPNFRGTKTLADRPLTNFHGNKFCGSRPC